MKKARYRLIDTYFEFPLRSDLVLILILWIISLPLENNISVTVNVAKFDNMVSNILSSLISLTGFILASLTIIVTFKANIKSKNLSEAENSLELLLSSKNYVKIVKSFKDAIVELVICISILYILWLPIFDISDFKRLLVILFGILIMVITLVRSLFVLFNIIFFEFKEDHTRI